MARRRPDPLEAAFAKQDAAFEFFTKLGTPFYCFHDVDMAPAGDTLKASRDNLTRLVDRAEEKMSETGRPPAVGDGQPVLPPEVRRRCRDQP